MGGGREYQSNPITTHTSDVSVHACRWQHVRAVLLHAVGLVYISRVATDVMPDNEPAPKVMASLSSRVKVVQERPVKVSEARLGQGKARHRT